MEQQKTWLFLLFSVKRTVRHVCLWKPPREQQHRSHYKSNKVLICASLAEKGPQFCKPSNSNSGLCKQPEEWLQICWLCVVCLSGITWGNEVTTGRNIVFSIFNKYQILRAGGPDEEKPGPSVCLGSWQSGRFSHTGKPLEKNVRNAINVHVKIQGDHWWDVSNWSGFWLLGDFFFFFSHLNINKADLKPASPPISTVLLPSVFSLGLFIIDKHGFPVLPCDLPDCGPVVCFCSWRHTSATVQHWQQTSWRRCHLQKLNIDFSDL